jgi:predicted  nucleic acid-binding Zn-ribbon protein
MAVVKDLHVEEKLKALFQLQKIDAKINEIKTFRGELPMEVRDLEDELEGFKTRISHYEEDVKNADEKIAGYKAAKKEAEALVKKYEKQQDNVKNNREFDALSKEIELQKLEVQLCEKRTKDAAEDAKIKATALSEAQDVIKEKEKFLNSKKIELESVIEETEAEENTLFKKSEKSRNLIDERLLTSYDKIKRNYRNGLAVVSIQRGSCGGCFNQIPPQKQLEIRQHRKIIACEHCGRILVDDSLDM